MTVITKADMIRERRRYSELRDRAQRFANDIYHALHTRINMFRYPKEEIQNSSWNLKDLYERTQAAQQLGYEVVLTVTDEGLQVQYQKKLNPVRESFY